MTAEDKDAIEERAKLMERTRGPGAPGAAETPRGGWHGKGELNWPVFDAFGPGC